MRSLLSTGFAAAACALVAAGCGAHGSRNVAAFERQAATPEGQAILRSIGIYRTSRDYRLACSLITPHFLRSRYDGQEHGCEALSSETPRTLPRSARVATVAGDAARVRIHELTATESVYVMRRLGGTWKIDDIVSPPGA